MKFQRQWKLSSSILQDPIKLAHLIETYTRSNNLNAGKHLHAHLIRSVRKVCKYVNNYLLNLYAKCGHLDYAQKLFDRMPQRNLVSWTALISAFSQHSQCAQALRAFSQMRASGESPNEFTFSSVIQATTLLRDVGFGRQMHCLSVKCGFSCELFVGSNLADMYSKCGVIYDGCKVFEEMPYKDEVSWTSMIHGYAKNGDFKEALLGFKTMLFEAIPIDNYAISSTLSACGAMSACTFGRSIHSMVVKSGFLEGETTVGNALVDMYSKVGDMESASKVFGNDSWRVNIVSYTSLIDGFVEAGQVEEALEVFVDLRRQGMEPNEFTFSSLVKACANQAALEQGSQLHAQAIKMNFAADPYVLSTLVFMYGKCGLVEHSERLFNCTKNQTEFAWNSLLAGYSQHGLGKEVTKVFERMVLGGVKPTAITFIILLTGCSHSGLVEEGMDYFNSMKDYGVTPTVEHYSCVIDLLSRSGKLKEADEFISQMPFEPNAFGWSSYLGACKNQGDRARAEIAAEKLMKLEPDNSSIHILLSSIYAKERQWEEVRNLRKMIKDGNIRKVPGYSWIDVGNKIHVFGAHEFSHPHQREIYNKLDSLIDEIKKVGYIPQRDVVDVDIDDDTKEKMLRYHSEKIAVAFALMSLPSWKPIIIKKNLRICLDCHSAFKLIAKVTGRRIIVRDSSRFHHFSDGSCSCRDFW